MLVYRLEDYSGAGVYCSGAASIVDFDKIRHPMPGDDSLLMENLGSNRFGPFVFGFSSIDQFRNWFYKDEWLVSLSDYGINLCIYDSGEVYQGHSQLVFRKETSELVSKNDLIEFFKLSR